ncbi:CAP domain-containing protein [Fredinandcohnia quinoae]|uniref:CAP domain-containing protein n=1 Tax=Fredinandcohnia quinoae TaxID=2918902 RepID=A0AAW5DX63_9BACI|nr:CAP domain-containing protein [Fredinandcohnia sp. SECRCQ15]MCH1623909.1 CAP domain-containing protein [Fredinandcohnia sp. SECRCQ15]
MIVIIFLLVIISGIYMYSSNQGKSKLTKSITNTPTVIEKNGKDTNLTSLKENEHKIQKYEGLYSFIGMNRSEIEEKLGKPNRIDKSSYDYSWWVYNTDLSNYIQIGIENDRVVTAFGMGDKVAVNPFRIGQAIEEIEKQGIIKQVVSLSPEKNLYRFELTEEEMEARPLVSIGEVYIQLYVDTFTNEISSIRFMDEETLIKQLPYDMVYRGKLVTPKKLTNNEWREVEVGNTAQILDITNAIRIRHNLEPVEWDVKVAEVAYNHSKDMSTQDYFSHTSPTYGGLADRLAKGEVIYQYAGENIAAKYVDAIAAVEGWLNSEGHRDTLLNGKFNHLGVGVYEKYYTQNFIQKWEQ